MPRRSRGRGDSLPDEVRRERPEEEGAEPADHRVHHGADRPELVLRDHALLDAGRRVDEILHVSRDRRGLDAEVLDLPAHLVDPVAVLAAHPDRPLGSRHFAQTSSRWSGASRRTSRWIDVPCLYTPMPRISGHFSIARNAAATNSP